MKIERITEIVNEVLKEKEVTENEIIIFFELHGLEEDVDEENFSSNDEANACFTNYTFNEVFALTDIDVDEIIEVMEIHLVDYFSDCSEEDLEAIIEIINEEDGD